MSVIQLCAPPGSKVNPAGPVRVEPAGVMRESQVPIADVESQLPAIHPPFVGVSYRDVHRAGQQGDVAAIGPRLTGGHRPRTADV